MFTKVEGSGLEVRGGGGLLSFSGSKILRMASDSVEDGNDGGGDGLRPHGSACLSASFAAVHERVMTIVFQNYKIIFYETIDIFFYFNLSTFFSIISLLP